MINGEFRQYRGTRDSYSLIAFVEDQKWKELNPVSPWKNPDSIQMTIVSYFFKLSHYLKEVNNVMLVEYGFPAWVTYVLFAIATILLGALLGLILVSIIDLIFPPVPQNSRKSFTQVQEASVGSQEEEVKDDLVDDEENEASDDKDGDDPVPTTSEDEKYSGSESNNSADEKEDDGKYSNASQKESKGESWMKLWKFVSHYLNVFQKLTINYWIIDSKNTRVRKEI